MKPLAFAAIALCAAACGAPAPNDAAVVALPPSPAAAEGVARGMTVICITALDDPPIEYALVENIELAALSAEGPSLQQRLLNTWLTHLRAQGRVVDGAAAPRCFIRPPAEIPDVVDVLQQRAQNQGGLEQVPWPGGA